MLIDKGLGRLLRPCKSKIIFLHRLFLAWGLLLMSMASHSMTMDEFDESKLWLTAKYESHFLALKQAAVLVANTPRCAKLLEATIDLEKTTSMFTFYKVLCRGTNNRTYFEIVDGNALKILKEEKPAVEKLGLCQTRLDQQTKLMQNVERLFDESIKPTSKTEQKTQYTLPFNAKTMQGMILKYQANCAVTDKGVTFFDIEARK